jgi:hypothetical protein
LVNLGNCSPLLAQALNQRCRHALRKFVQHGRMGRA